MGKLGFWLVWGLFLGYAFFFAPPDRPETLTLIQRLITGDIAGINPAIVALFNLMGVLPCAYACILCTDGQGQKVPAWLFALSGFFVGAFALLPYFALRQDNPQFVGEKSWAVKILDSRLTGLVVASLGIFLLLYGLRFGDWADFALQWRSSRFIHVMSLDFCLLCALFPWLLKDDMLRRGWDSDTVFMAVASFPLLGPLVYLCVRPSVIPMEQKSSST
jgi:hypothetical protein